MENKKWETITQNGFVCTVVLFIIKRYSCAENDYATHFAERHKQFSNWRFRDSASSCSINMFDAMNEKNEKF